MIKARWDKRSRAMNRLFLLIAGVLCAAAFSALPALLLTPPAEREAAGRRIATYDESGARRWLTLTREPRRIVVLDWNNLEILLAFGLGDRIVLACMDEDHEADLRQRYPKEFAKIQAIAPHMASQETIIAAAPDLIMARQSAFSRSWLGAASWWRQRGVATYIPITSNNREPQTIENELQYILDIGIMFNRQEEAAAKVAQLRDRIRALAAQTAGREQPRVMVLEGSPAKYIASYNSHWLIGDFLRTLGAHMATERRFIDIESLLLLDPAVIFVEYFDETTLSFMEDLLHNPKFHSLTAVREGRIYPVPVSFLYMTGLRTAEGLSCIAAGLYPEIDWAEP